SCSAIHPVSSIVVSNMVRLHPGRGDRRSCVRPAFGGHGVPHGPEKMKKPCETSMVMRVIGRLRGLAGPVHCARADIGKAGTGRPGIGTALAVPAARREGPGAIRRSEQERGVKRKKTRQYGRKSSQKVERAMHEMKRGQLKSGRSGRKVTSRRQA